MSLPLWITSRHALVTAVGITHASRVIAVVRSSEAESGTFTRADEPLNASPPL